MTSFPQCLQDEIFSSSFAAAMFLKVNDFPREKKVSLSTYLFYLVAYGVLDLRAASVVSERLLMLHELKKQKKLISR